MLKKDLILIIVLVVGLSGIVGIWYFRYGFAYELGFSEGFIEGNVTGHFKGIEEGMSFGYAEGYELGFSLGNEQGENNGYQIGYEKGREEGLSEGYEIGFDEGNTTGHYDGYTSGVLSGSRGYDLRDPTKEEALFFIEMDNTDELFQMDADYSDYSALNYIRKNAAEQGFRCLWMQVKTIGSPLFFCAFNTTDSGFLYFNFRNDIIHDLQIGEHSFDTEIYVHPDFDDTITRIESIS